LRGLAINLASIYQTENPRSFSEVGENKQLNITVVPVAQDTKKSYLLVCKARRTIKKNCLPSRQAGLLTFS
jgi:hypothetical protein